MYSLEEPTFGQYVQPNGQPEVMSTTVTVVLSKLRNVAADSHSAMSVMSSPEGQVPFVIV